MTIKPKPDEDFRMNADEFDRMMRGALSASPPPDEPKKTTKAPKPLNKAKPTLKKK